MKTIDLKNREGDWDSLKQGHALVHKVDPHPLDETPWRRTG
jgi:hypothetical protein